MRAPFTGNGLQERKADGLKAMREPAFWDSDERYETLAEIQYLDRLETALETAVRLAQRLDPRRENGSADLQALVAGRLTSSNRRSEGSPTALPTMSTSASASPARRTL